MAKYRVETDNGTYEVETDEGTAAPTAAPQEGDSPMKAAFKFAARELNPPAIGTKALGMAQQGLRGLGVGAQRLLQGEGSEKALERANEAVKPGFTPIDGERIGSIAGPALPLLPIAGVLPAAGIAGAATMGERLNAGDSAKDALTEGATDAAIVAATGGVLKGAQTAGTALFRNVLAKGKGLTRDAVNFVLDNPEVKRAVGSDEAVGAAINNLKGTLAEARKVAGKKIGELRKSLGLKPALEEAEARILSEVEARPLKAIIEDVNSLTPEAATKDGLDKLLRLKEEIRDLQKFSQRAVDPRMQLRQVDDALLSQKVEQIDSLIEAVPEGRQLATLQDEYSDIMSEFKDFVLRLNTPGQAEQALQSIIRKGDGLTGRLQDMVKSIQAVEQRTRSNKLGVALAEAGKRLFDSATGDGVLGAGVETLEKTVGKGAVKLAAQSPKLFNIVRRPTQAIIRGLAKDIREENRGK